VRTELHEHEEQHFTPVKWRLPIYGGGSVWVAAVGKENLAQILPAAGDCEVQRSFAALRLRVGVGAMPQELQARITHRVQSVTIMPWARAGRQQSTKKFSIRHRPAAPRRRAPRA
jgi:hypothetical protein